jgi:hypothetical protein
MIQQTDRPTFRSAAKHASQIHVNGLAHCSSYWVFPQTQKAKRVGNMAKAEDKSGVHTHCVHAISLKQG